MRLDDEGLCWLCDKPLESERSAASWHGFGVHRVCAREEGARTEGDARPEEDAPEDATSRLDKYGVIGTST
jgi:hypothetical protein